MNYSDLVIKDYLRYQKRNLKERFTKLAIDKPNKTNNYLQINNWSRDAEDSNMYLKQLIKDCEYYGIEFHIWSAENINSIVVDDKSYTPPMYGVEHNPVPTINISTGFVIDKCLNDFNDVEGATPGSRYIPAVAKGIIDFLQFELGYTVQDKNVLIIGRGPTMGSRLIRGFMNHHANVMVAHSRTSEEQLQSMMAIADIIITATSVPEQFNNLSCAFASLDTILIDAGTCFNNEGKLVGNCNKDCYGLFDHAIGVPGGVGPLTRLALFENIFRTMDEIV